MEENNLPDDNALEETISMEGYDGPVKRARTMLFVVAGLQLFTLVFTGNLEGVAKAITISITVFIAAVFITVAFWTKIKPYTAIITALILYTALVIINTIIDPSTLFMGWIIKILVYVLLIPSLSNAKEVQRWLDMKKK